MKPFFTKTSEIALLLFLLTALMSHIYYLNRITKAIELNSLSTIYLLKEFQKLNTDICTELENETYKVEKDYIRDL